LEPRFCGRWIGVPEVVGERFSPAFQLFEHAFDGVPISVRLMLESEAVTVTGRLQPGRTIDQQERIVDEMFLFEFGEEHLGQRLGSGREQPDVE
jgi:hypothetical protein